MRKLYSILITILMVYLITISSFFSFEVHADVTTQNMEKIYQLTRSYIYDDTNVLSYTVEWYYASGYVNNQLYHYYAGYVREIPDAGNGDSNTRWYVDHFDPKFEITSFSWQLYDIDPSNPTGCISSWSGGFSFGVEATPDGPVIQIGLHYHYTVEPYKLSIDVPSTYPEARWVFDPCSIQYGSAWRGEAAVMYTTTSSASMKINILTGATYSKEVKRCLLGDYLCWWEYAGGNGHYHLWSISISPP